MVKKEKSLELIIANKELAFQNDKNKKRGFEIINFQSTVEGLEKLIRARIKYLQIIPCTSCASIITLLGCRVDNFRP